MISDEQDNKEETETLEEDTENYKTSHNERRPRSKERGPDKKPRTYRASSMRNLNQFSKRPVEFETYLKDQKGVCLSEKKYNITKLIPIIVGIGLIIFGMLYFYDRKNRQNDEKSFQ